MAAKNTYLTMTSDDLRAARIFTLAVKFFGASTPLTSSEIKLDLYADLSDDAFARQYLRDRDLLATMGIIIKPVDGPAGEGWLIDEHASYVQDCTISPMDARVLYVLCHDLAYDQSFAYRDELRMALAKISQMYRGSAIPSTDATTSAEHKVLATLIPCLERRHGVSVTYTTAAGKKRERTLALLGSFGLRDHTYFVAAQVEKEGDLVADSIRTYRLDRFERVQELAGITYQIPDDFFVGDYERLPFQMGPSRGIAQFKVGDEPGREARAAMATAGDLVGENPVLWEVPYSDLEAAAGWAIGVGLVPEGPGELVSTWNNTLARTFTSIPYQASLADYLSAPTPQMSRGRRGRAGGITLVRQLVALANSLTNEGQIITADDIAQTLGITFDDARHLIALVSMGSGESIDYLPVVLGDRDEDISLMEGAALDVRRIRLTQSETIALARALKELGVPETDPLVQAITSAFASPGFTEESVAQALEIPRSSQDSATLRLCSQAIAEGLGLEFDYQPVSGGTVRRRQVAPQIVRHSDGSWYLEAFDLQREADRVFRIDHMSETCMVDPPPFMPQQGKTEDAKLVVVRFFDPHYLDLFHWNGMEVLERTDQATTIRLPSYGGTWLPRHLAACGGTIRVSDQTLARRIVDAARICS